MTREWRGLPCAMYRVSNFVCQCYVGAIVGLGPSFCTNGFPSVVPSAVLFINSFKCYPLKLTLAFFWSCEGAAFSFVGTTFYSADMHRYLMARLELAPLSLLLLVLVFVPFSSCIPVESSTAQLLVENEPPNNAQQPQQVGGFSVLGMAAFGNITTQPRREIRDMERNHPDEWNIYLLGLARMQRCKQTDKLSYFQIAGT
jgi:hypothetical protein